MNLTLIRTDMLKGLTFGLLNIDDVFFCHTLEDEDRKLEVNPTGKIYGETAIPRGKYVVVLDFSHRFKVIMPHVLGVPQFDGIRIHPGNKTVDTHGCILTGRERDRKNNALIRSREAYDALMDRLTGAKNITLEVL